MGRLTIATKFNTARLLQFVFPAVAMMIVTSIYVMTDGIFISQFAGSEQLSLKDVAKRCGVSTAITALSSGL